jgi:hypothetical protein
MGKRQGEMKGDDSLPKCDEIFHAVLLLGFIQWKAPAWGKTHALAAAGEKVFLHRRGGIALLESAPTGQTGPKGRNDFWGQRCFCTTSFLFV